MDKSAAAPQPPTNGQGAHYRPRSLQRREEARGDARGTGQDSNPLLPGSTPALQALALLVRDFPKAETRAPKQGICL